MMISYRESSDGQVLQEGISEAAGMGSFTASGTSHATHGETTIPFFIFYSMFGFQRVGDLIWAAGDARAKGFLLGGTAGRTTLNGEGLQHQDGHSLLVAGTVPSVRAYDAAFAYEVAVIIRDGLRSMYEEGEDVVYYLALYNESYVMPAMPAGCDAGIVRGGYLLAGQEGEGSRARILASGPMVPLALQVRSVLATDHGISAAVYSVTSYQRMRQDALDVETWNRANRGRRRIPYVTELLAQTEGPAITVSDWMRAVPDQVARWIPGPYMSLGTDGYGRSDTRAALRAHFEVDTLSIVAAVREALDTEKAPRQPTERKLVAAVPSPT